MSKSATLQSVPAPSQEAVRQRFDELAQVWRSETKYLSSTTAISMHPAYQQIIAMGAAVVPILLDELAHESGHWFWALKAITGCDPVSLEQRGDRDAMTRAWLQWGRTEGYLA